MNIKRNVLLNPGPATTTDTVKMAQVVADICPREKEFGELMRNFRRDILGTVHADPEVYTSVLFCGSGTINIDICLNSLLPENKKVLVINNGAYSARAVEVCRYYGLDYLELKYPVDERPKLSEIDELLQNHPEVALVYTTHHETGTGLLNPVREIGEIVHRHKAVFAVDTTSSLAMIPIDVQRDNIDFCMASAQKGIQGMAGLSFIIGKRLLIEQSAGYPKRSYYCNLYLQYEFFEKTGEMHFTPPVQTVYAAKQALSEYYEEGEQEKWARHTRVFEAIHKGLDRLGFQDVIRREWQSGLVVAVRYPDDENWDFERVHDYCYERGFTIYPGKIDSCNTFRLCALGAIDEKDIIDFFTVFEEGLKSLKISVPARYNA